MSDTPWTPGPWTDLGPTDFRGRLIVGESRPDPELEADDGMVHTAVAEALDAEGADVRANARLIAAAPEMADCLFYFVASADDEAVSDLAQATYTNCVEQARAILSRLRGEA